MLVAFVHAPGIVSREALLHERSNMIQIEATARSLRNSIHNTYPDAIATSDGLAAGHVATQGYLLFMCDKILGEFSTSENKRKALRWLGYAVAHAEILGLMEYPMPHFASTISRDHYYCGTIRSITHRIEERYTSCTSESTILNPDKHALLLILEHVIEHVNGLDPDSDEDSCLAAFLIGWVLAHAELHDLLTNAESRNLVRADVKNGYE
jgi:hypothetical protein